MKRFIFVFALAAVLIAAFQYLFGWNDFFCRLEELVKETGNPWVFLAVMGIGCAFGLPLSFAYLYGGMAFGVEPASVRRVTEAVKRACNKPVITKLTPNVSNIADNAKAAEDGGADAISLINTLTGMAVDYRTRRPVLANNTGGLSGPCVKPVALKMVWDCHNAVKVPIIGLGGIQSYTDVLEFMICGATAVQVGTATLSDPYAAYNIAKDLENYARENDADLNELIGTLQLNG